MLSFDLHQHLWPEAFVAALARRTSPPRLEGETLALAGGRRYPFDLRAHALEERLRTLESGGVDVAVVSLQPTLGIEMLPEPERAELLGAYHEGVLELVAASGGRLRALGAGSAPTGTVGATVSAPELVAALLHAEEPPPVLGELEGRGLFVFVHPGPAESPEGAPAWWGEAVGYTAQMQAAYAAWLARGLTLYPALPVVFAILAGGAPVQLERLASRGVDTRLAASDRLFFDTASYGRRALELALATFGVRPLVYGSDTPVIDPGPTLQALASFGDAVADAVRRDNPSQLLG